jgi:pyruvate dehydrogenase (quinone)
MSTSTRTSRRCPGKVEYQQATKFARTFLRGQSRESTIETTLFRDKIEHLKP